MNNEIERFLTVPEEAGSAVEGLGGPLGELTSSMQEWATEGSGLGGEVGNLKSTVEQGLQKLSSRFDEASGEIERTMTSVEQEAQGLQDSIGAVRMNLEQALTGAEDQLRELGTRMSEGHQTLSQANDAAQKLILTTHEHVETGRKALEEAYGAANERVDALQQKLGTMEQQTLEKAEGLVSHMTAGLGEAQEHVGEMIGTSFQQIVDTFHAGVDAIQNDVIERGVEEATDEVRQQIQEELQKVIDAVVEQLSTVLDRTKEALFGETEDARGTRRLTEPILNQLEGMVDPLESAFDHIRSMASMVGIDL